VRRTIVALAATAGAVVLVTGAGLAAASASPAGKSGTEHFYLMTTENSSAKSEVIATGLFTAYGFDIEGSTVDTAHVTGGTFKIDHPNSGFKIIKESVNPKTCFAVFEAKATIKLTGGTGAYKGISGSGSALITELEITAKSKGKCNPNVNPVANERTISATAHVTL
jgi:hypothetical protein